MATRRVGGGSKNLKYLTHHNEKPNSFVRQRTEELGVRSYSMQATAQSVENLEESAAEHYTCRPALSSITAVSVTDLPGAQA